MQGEISPVTYFDEFKNARSVSETTAGQRDAVKKSLFFMFL